MENKKIILLRKIKTLATVNLILFLIYFTSSIAVNILVQINLEPITNGYFQSFGSILALSLGIIFIAIVYMWYAWFQLIYGIILFSKLRKEADIVSGILLAMVIVTFICWAWFWGVPVIILAIVSLVITNKEIEKSHT